MMITNRIICVNGGERERILGSHSRVYSLTLLFIFSGNRKYSSKTQVIIALADA
jgi:hypothetical protein